MRIGAFGEVMLRFTPREHQLLEQARDVHLDYTGTGVNILGNLAHLGLKTEMLTALPANRLGDAAEAALRGYGMGTAHVLRSHDYLGSYFAELGFGSRPTIVTYQNRRSSAFCVAKPLEFDFNGFLDEVDLVHICGISLSLTDSTAESALELARRAHDQGVKVCFDFNFRPSLNEQPGKLDLLWRRYEEMLPLCDIVFGARRDLVRHFGDEAHEGEGASGRMAARTTDELVELCMERYEIAWFVGTEKKASKTDAGVARTLSGILYEQKTGDEAEPMESPCIKKHQSRPQSVTVLDRIGAGDAYAAGILYGYACKWDISRTLDFAVGNAVLANTIPGDVPLTTETMVEAYLDDPANDLLR